MLTTNSCNPYSPSPSLNWIPFYTIQRERTPFPTKYSYPRNAKSYLHTHGLPPHPRAVRRSWTYFTMNTVCIHPLSRSFDSIQESTPLKDDDHTASRSYFSRPRMGVQNLFPHLPYPRQPCSEVPPPLFFIHARAVSSFLKWYTPLSFKNCQIRPHNIQCFQLFKKRLNYCLEILDIAQCNSVILPCHQVKVVQLSICVLPLVRPDWKFHHPASQKDQTFYFLHSFLTAGATAGTC